MLGRYLTSGRYMFSLLEMHDAYAIVLTGLVR